MKKSVNESVSAFSKLSYRPKSQIIRYINYLVKGEVGRLSEPPNQPDFQI